MLVVKREDGAAAVEFALLASLLLLLIFAIVEFGIGFFTQQAAAASAREAARQAAVGTITSCTGTSYPSDLQAIVDDVANAGSVTGESLQYKDPTNTTVTTSPQPGDAVDVTVDYHIDLSVLSALIPGVPSSLDLSQTGTAMVENWATDGVTSCP